MHFEPQTLCKILFQNAIFTIEISSVVYAISDKIGFKWANITTTTQANLMAEILSSLIDLFSWGWGGD